MKNVKKMVDRALALYLIVGVLNFIFCTALMFFLYNVCGFSEHVAPIINYGLGSLIWYLGCEYIVFPGHPHTLQLMIRFAVEVVICYVISYYMLAELIANWALQYDQVYELFTFGGGAKVVANCEMAIGSIVYALINYFGQRFFVFSERFDYHRK